MKRWIAVVTLVFAAGVWAATKPPERTVRSAGYFPCMFLNSPVSCAIKSGGQCTWQNNACVPAQ